VGDGEGILAKRILPFCNMPFSDFRLKMKKAEGSGILYFNGNWIIGLELTKNKGKRLIILESSLISSELSFKHFIYFGKRKLSKN